MVDDNIDPGKPKVTGKADIVFVIDSSGSMVPVQEKVKQWLPKFINDVLTRAAQNLHVSPGQVVYSQDDPTPHVSNNAMDVRVGVIMQNASQFVCLKSRFGTLPELQALVEGVPFGGDELTLTAVEYAMDEFFQDSGQRHRFVVVLTDEPSAGGHNRAGDQASYKQLAQKFFDGIAGNILFFGPPCEVHQGFVSEVAALYNAKGKTNRVVEFVAQPDHTTLQDMMQRDSTHLDRIMARAAEGVSSVVGQRAEALKQMPRGVLASARPQIVEK
jgi:hypothetical protein